MSLCPDNPYNVTVCSDFAKIYLRPDQGMSIMPWLLIVILLTIHLPLVVLRVVRWESVQILSLGMAAFVITLTCVAYGSTKLDPKYILIWPPIGLAIDVGAMSQVFVLVLEKPEDRMRVKTTIRRWFNWINLFEKRDQNGVGTVTHNTDAPVIDTEQSNGANAESKEPSIQIAPCVAPDEEQQAANVENTQPFQPIIQPRADEEQREAKRRTVGSLITMLTVSGLFLLALVTLQLYGLVKATKGQAQSSNLTQRWCSPAIQSAKVLWKERIQRDT